MPKVLNTKNPNHMEEDSVYIGRGSPYGNPFPINATDDRDTVVRKFKEYFYSNQQLMKLVRANLRGKNLRCFCAPLACHGDILLEYANS